MYAGSATRVDREMGEIAKELTASTPPLAKILTVELRF
jgi:hypothetical protein